jgi:16S rRNA C1402 (ribose-2'-O) methylase RsmI
MAKGTQNKGLTTLLAVLTVLVVGCASRASQDQVKQGVQSPPLGDPVQMKGPFLSPHMRSFNEELRAASTQSKTTEVQYRLKELESTLHQTMDRLEHLAQDFRKTQEELERVRLERALERQAAEQRSGRGVIRLEEEMPASANRPESQPKASVQSGEARQRIQDLMEQIKGLLERY